MSEHDDAGARYADGRQRYRLDSRIAVGGMGEVWRATDTLLGRRVAVKLLKPEYADDPMFRSRFATEAQHAAALDHPGVASVFDVGESGPGDSSDYPRPYLVMELVDGQPLSTLLSEGRQSGRGIDREVLRDLLAQSAIAIGAAHASGIVHRDVKPANLLVTPDRRVKITDFGIARAADSVGITQTGQVMGTPQYLSPEQARGEPATAASDVYALGVVAFECLAGRRPFEADSPVATALAHLQQPVPELPDDVPADLAAVVRTALAKDPRDRYPDGSAFAAALNDPATAVLPGGPAATSPVARAAGAGLAGAGMAAGGELDDAADGTRVMPTGSFDPERPSTLETPVAPPPSERTSGRPVALLGVVGGLLLVLAAMVGVFLLFGDETGTTPPGGGEASESPPSSEATAEATSEPPPTPSATLTSQAPTTATSEPTPTPSPTPTQTEEPTPTQDPTPTAPEPSASATVGETAASGGTDVSTPTAAPTTGSAAAPGEQDDAGDQGDQEDRGPARAAGGGAPDDGADLGAAG